MIEIGKVLIGIGIAIVLIGGLFLIVGRLGLPLGRLPGDIISRSKSISVYIPLGTCILLSIVLTAVMYLISRFRH